MCRQDDSNSLTDRVKLTMKISHHQGKKTEKWIMLRVSIIPFLTCSAD